MFLYSIFLFSNLMLVFFFQWRFLQITVVCKSSSSYVFGLIFNASSTFNALSFSASIKWFTLYCQQFSHTLSSFSNFPVPARAHHLSFSCVKSMLHMEESLSPDFLCYPSQFSNKSSSDFLCYRTLLSQFSDLTNHPSI